MEFKFRSIILFQKRIIFKFYVALVDEFTLLSKWHV